MPDYKIFLSFVFAAFMLSGIAFPVKAKAEASHALIMHGPPKYAADFDHLEYTNPEAPKGGVLREAVVGSFDTLNNHIIMGTMARGLDLTVDRLMQRVWDEPFALYGLVAESIEIAEDRSWIIFNLNPKARFHDGAPMTVEDVIFSYETYRNHGHPVRRRVYSFVDQVEKLSERSVKFSFGEGYDQETALILAIMPVIPKHYWQDRDITKTTLTPLLGSGPYRIKDVAPGRHIHYERVEDYWARDLPVNRGLYNFDEIRYVYYRDAGISLEAFKAGETDLRREHDVSRWMTGYTSSRRDQGEFVQKEYSHRRPEQVRAFIFNTRREMFSDIRVRQALSLAFHFGQMNEMFFGNVFKRIESYFPNSELAHQGIAEGKEREILMAHEQALPAEVFGPAFAYPPTTRSQDRRAALRQAAALLKDAGYVISDKRLVNAQTGEAFTFEILLNAAPDEKIALFFRETLQRLGIEVNIRTVDTAQFTGRLDMFDYDMVLYQWINSLSPGNEQMNYWGSAAATATGSRNYAGIENPVIDQLAIGIGASETREDLVAYTHALDRVLMQGYYSIPLYYLGADMIAHHRDLQAPAHIPIYGTVIESWWRSPQ